MIRINTDSYSSNDKISICKEFLIPELLSDFNFSSNDLVFDNDIINYIITKTEKEDGVRNLKRSIECIISNLNILRLINKNNTNLNICNLDIEFSLPFKINTKVVDYLIKNMDDFNPSIAHLYT
jgi:ATP-dependent Lon protease